MSQSEGSSLLSCLKFAETVAGMAGGLTGWPLPCVRAQARCEFGAEFRYLRRDHE